MSGPGAGRAETSRAFQRTSAGAVTLIMWTAGAMATGGPLCDADLLQPWAAQDGAHAAGRGADGAIDESLARAFREFRAAEVGGGSAAVDELQARWTQPFSAERGQLARRAIEARARATTASALVDAEDALARERLMLAERLAAADAAAARELLLEYAEDLLLRRLVADGSDGALAIGMPTARQLDAARTVVARVDAALALPVVAPLLIAEAGVATDGPLFRTRLLAGLARVVEADLLAVEAAGATDTTVGARAAAAAHLEVAARSELPLPKEVTCVLALARARAQGPTAAVDVDRRMQRTRLLALAATSEDPMRAYVAAVEAWHDGGGTGAFPPVREDSGAPGASGRSEGGMRLLAALAECRARRVRGEPADRIAAPLERALRASMAPADRASALAQLRGTAAAIAVRLDAATRAMARRGDAPVLLKALVAMSEAETALMAEQSETLRIAARDALVAPWLAVPLARVLREQGRAEAAADVLLSLIEVAPEIDGVDAVAAIAVALSRGEAARSASGEVLLDRALEVAARHVDDRAARDAWTLERVDLALFPQHTAANAARAAEVLQLVSTRIETRLAREVRALEVDGARAGASHADARRVADQAALLADALAGEDRMLLARVETLRAAMLLASDRPAEACVYAAHAMGESSGGKSIARVDHAADGEWMAERTTARAAEIWITAAIARGEVAMPPEAIRSLIARHPRFVETAALALETARAALEQAVVERDGRRAARDAASRLQPLARLLAEAAPEDASIGEMAALADLTAGDAAAAEVRIAAVVERSPDARSARWVLAECLRARSDAGGDAAIRARSFALFRELAPMAAESRDDIWWRAQIGQLEILATDPARAQDIRARMNRLAALDASLGGKPLARRVAALRAMMERAAADPGPATGGSPTR